MSEYDDIIYLPHHQSKVHPHMSMEERAAQFSPFAALTGYGDAIDQSTEEAQAAQYAADHSGELIEPL